MLRDPGRDQEGMMGWEGMEQKKEAHLMTRFLSGWPQKHCGRRGEWRVEAVGA
jgi:hypothetical protein